MSFADKVVLVIGASSGIGAATAVLFAKEAASVAIVGRNEKKLAKVVEECGKVGKRPLVIKADVSHDEEAKKIVQETIDKFGQLDVLVNNAGIMRTGTLKDDKVLQCYDEIMATNVRALINITSLATPHLIKTKGNIINVSSIASMFVDKTSRNMAYHVSKAALDQFTRCAAAELASSGVRVNSVNPGPVKTDILENAGETNFEWDNIALYSALGRVSEPEEIADLIMYLAGDKAKGITGSLFVNDNGFLLKS